MIYIWRLIFLSALPLLCFFESCGEGKLKIDPAVRMGVLENGMTYFIRANDFPEKRASFYIIRNVGALVEDENQNGLAHFLEHMAFNGTRHFPGKGIIRMLENYGVASGNSVNAYTSYNETVYNLSNVPSGNEMLLDSCLLVLRDWADGLTLEEEEIDAERNVILEEARQGRNADFRLRQQTMPVLAAGSQYAVRNIIGSEKVIRDFPYDVLHDFYRDWYRTDLQAVVIVGDFDPGRMEQKVKRVMSGIPAVENVRPRPFYEIPSHEDVRYVLATDPEASRTNLALNILHEACRPGQKDGHYLKEQLAINLYNTMMRGRINEMGRKGNAPFLSAGSGIYPFVRGYDLYTISVTPKPGLEEEAFKLVYRETERVRQQGFTEAEFDRTRNSFLDRLEQSMNSSSRTSNEDYVQAIQEYFLEGEPLLADGDYYRLMISLLKEVDLQEVSDLAQRYLGRKNMTFTVTAPANGEKHLAKEELLQIMDDVTAENLSAWTEQSASTCLLNGDLPGGKLVSEKKIPDIKAVEWTLSNGATIIFRKSYLERGQVLLTARSKGGYSLYEREDIPAALYLPEWLAASGIGDMDASSFTKYMSGKQAGCDIALGEFSEKLNGGSTVKDVETLLQLVYMRFERPRFDETAFHIGMERARMAVAGMERNPEKIMRDSITAIMNNYHPRIVEMNEQTLGSITPEQMEHIYRERFSNASDFVFFIVADMEEKRLLPLVEKYIGSIPGNGKKEQIRDCGIRGPQGNLEKEIRLPFANEKATVLARYTKEMKNTPANEVYFSILASALESRLNERLREQDGGTYGVSVMPGGTKEPYESFYLSVSFDCEPGNAARMRKGLEEVMGDFCKTGPSMDEVKKLARNMLLEEDQAKMHNDYWMEVIYAWKIDGIDISAPENYRNILKTVRPEDIRAFAGELIGHGNQVVLTFRPE